MVPWEQSFVAHSGVEVVVVQGEEESVVAVVAKVVVVVNLEHFAARVLRWMLRLALEVVAQLQLKFKDKNTFLTMKTN